MLLPEGTGRYTVAGCEQLTPLAWRSRGEPCGRGPTLPSPPRCPDAAC